MFAVFRCGGDGCTFSYETLLFVTADRELAQTSVELAEFELAEAREIPCPTWNIEDLKVEGGGERINTLRLEWEEKVNKIFTVDTYDGGCYLVSDREISYSFEQVEVR